MSKVDPNLIVESRDAFRGTGYRTLAEVRDEVARMPASSWRRDTLSALATVAKGFKLDLKDISASPPALQRLFASKTYGELGLRSQKRYENIRAAVLQASRVRRGRRPVRIALTHSDSWAKLLNRIPAGLSRHGLQRFAHYCSVTGTEPTQIAPHVLSGFLEALETEGVIARPKRGLINAITHWNWCARNVKGWPSPSRLSVPTDRVFFMKPWTDFPASLHEAFQAMARELAAPDAFSLQGPARAIRPATLRNYDVMVRNYASALIATGVPAKRIRRLGDLARTYEAFEATLRVLHERTGKEKPTEYLAKHARTILNIARYHCKTSDVQLNKMHALCQHLEPPQDRTLTQGNRILLRQFDDPKNVQALLSFPKKEHERGTKPRSKPLSAKRKAKYVERALAVGLLIACCPRIFNLRTLRLDDFQWRKDGTCHLEIPGSRVKNRVELSWVIPKAVADLLREFVSTHRSHLADLRNAYLFAGRGEAPRHQNSLREELMRSIREHTGLSMHPHLFRHVVAKLVLAERPELALHVSRMLGHKTPTMTYQKYLGTEGKEASKLLDLTLQDVLSGQTRRRK